MPHLDPSLTPAHRGRLYTTCAACFCLLFGLAYIANIHPIGDGLWYWYATLVRGGAKLYTDLHFNLQPFYVLATAAGQVVFGSGWIASKVVPALQLLLYVLMLFFVVRRIPWRDWERAVLLLAVFGIMIATPFFRFDDYHITTNLFEMASIVLLLRLQERRSSVAVCMVTAVLLGLLGGLSTANRLNDGAALIVANALALVFSVSHRRRLALPALALSLASAAAGLFGTVRLTGDGVHAWARESIFRAAQIKGGTHHIALIPLRLPFKVLHLAHFWPNDAAGIYCAIVVIGVLLPLPAMVASTDARRRRATWLIVAFVLLATYPVIVWYCLLGGFITPICDIAIVPLYGLNIWILCRMILVARGAGPLPWDRRETLLLIPFLQLLAAAATAGISMPMATPPLATSLLLLPLALPVRIPQGWPRQALVTALCFFAVVAYPPKWVHPYFWHKYDAGPMFEGRVIYRHPTLGPMLIERDQLNVIKPMCDKIQQSTPGGDLLSLPYPYPNYFCGLPPWHGYVQTWFDTSTRQTIQHLDAELETAPPKWIVYQRLLSTMDIHEAVFTNGQKLPQRELDALIVRKVATGQWHVMVYKVLNGSEWFLLQTGA